MIRFDVMLTAEDLDGFFHGNDGTGSIVAARRLIPQSADDRIRLPHDVGDIVIAHNLQQIALAVEQDDV